MPRGWTKTDRKQLLSQWQGTLTGGLTSSNTASWPEATENRANSASQRQLIRGMCRSLTPLGLTDFAMLNGGYLIDCWISSDCSSDWSRARCANWLLWGSQCITQPVNPSPTLRFNETREDTHTHTHWTLHNRIREGWTSLKTIPGASVVPERKCGGIWKTSCLYT